MAISENALETVKLIFLVLISKIQEEVRAEPNLINEDASKVRTNTAMVLDHISVCMDGIENTMQSAVVTDEVAQLPMDDNAFMKRRNALSNEGVLRLFNVAEILAIL